MHGQPTRQRPGSASEGRRVTAQRSASDYHHADTNTVLRWMRLEEAARDELNLSLRELLADGYLRGKELRGDKKALDVSVTQRYAEGRSSEIRRGGCTR